MTTASDTSKRSLFCDYSHRHGNFAPTTAADGRLQTVANGCKRLQTVANGCGRTVADAESRVTRTQVNPQTPNVKREPFATHSGKTLHRGAFAHRSWYAKTLLHRKTCTHRGTFTLRGTFTRKFLQYTENFYTQKLLHKETFYIQKQLHTEAAAPRSAFHRNNYTQKNFYTRKLLRTDACTHSSFDA